MAEAYMSIRRETKDAERLVIEWYGDDGERIEEAGSVTIDLSDLRSLGLSSDNLEVKLRIERSKDSATCAPIKRGVLATDWEEDTA